MAAEASYVFTYQKQAHSLAAEVCESDIKNEDYNDNRDIVMFTIIIGKESNLKHERPCTASADSLPWPWLAHF